MKKINLIIVIFVLATLISCKNGIKINNCYSQWPRSVDNIKAEVVKVTDSKTGVGCELKASCEYDYNKDRKKNWQLMIVLVGRTKSDQYFILDALKDTISPDNFSPTKNTYIINGTLFVQNSTLEKHGYTKDSFEYSLGIFTHSDWSEYYSGIKSVNFHYDGSDRVSQYPEHIRALE